MSHRGSIPSANVGEEGRPPKSGWGNFLERARRWCAYKDRREWVKDMKGSLSMTASIIATMTFQLATNPPGGVVQVDLNNAPICKINNGTKTCPGEAVMGIRNKSTYVAFMVCNTISFVASLSVCFLLVSGIPLDHTIPIWLLSIGMCITITSLTLTYLFAASMVTPDTIWHSVANNLFGVVLIVWVALAVVVGIFLTIRLLVRGVDMIEKRNRPHNRKNENRPTP